VTVGTFRQSALADKLHTIVKQERGLTQEQLAERSGFSQQYISGLEQGRRNPTVVTLYELALALGVDHLELLRDGEDE
jgi:transcriptional regulator with XRE-family HTH domain